MKYLLSLILFVSSFVYAQEPIYTPMRNNYQFRGIKMDSLFLIPSYPDTFNANTHSVKNIAGSMIRTGNDFWMRNAAKDAWLQNVNVGPGSSPVMNFVNNVFKKSGSDSVFYVISPADTFFAYIDDGIEGLINNNDSVYSYKNTDTTFQFSFSVPEDSIFNITYSSLVSLKSSSLLKPNKKYRITDYRTEFKIFGTSVDTFGIVEPLIVTALSDSSIANDAYSEKYPKDVIKYTLDNIGELSPSTGGKGTILFRNSLDSNLSAYYDWRNIIWKRWAINPAPSYYVAFQMFNSINSFQYKKTFGTNCHDISLGADVYNTTIWDNSHSIKLLGNTGVYTAGVTILDYCHDITIGENCSQVGTSGSGYIGGIYIGSSCFYIDIGKRSYNIAIGDGAYSVMLGNQQSDVYIRPSIYRRRLEKGFSNFDCTTSISSKQIDLYNTTISALPGYLYNTAQYCGIVNVTSSNAIDTLENLFALLTSVTFQPIEIRPISNQKIVLKDKSLTTGGNLKLGGNIVTIDGSKGEYVTLYKRMIDGLGTQTSDFYILNSNIIQNTNPASQNFANTDLTSTGNRTHTFTGNSLSIENASYIVMNSSNLSGTNTLSLQDGSGGIYGESPSSKFWGLNYSSDYNYLMLRNNSNNAYLSKRAFGTDTLALLSDLAGISGGGIDTIYRKSGKDSIFWKKNNVEYRIKDSVGGGSGTNSPDRINGTYTINNITSQFNNWDISVDGSLFKLKGNSSGSPITNCEIYAFDTIKLSTGAINSLYDQINFKSLNTISEQIFKYDTDGDFEIGNKGKNRLLIEVKNADSSIHFKSINAMTWNEPAQGLTSQVLTGYALNSIDASTADYYIPLPGVYEVTNAPTSAYYVYLPDPSKYAGQQVIIKNTDYDYLYPDLTNTDGLVIEIKTNEIATFLSVGNKWISYKN